jgi:hypothetical protein
MECLMKRLVLFAFLFCTIHAMAASTTATTRPVRQDGGTRYSLNQTNGLCTGAYNAVHPGYEGNQNCVFDDVRYLWADGSNADSRSPITSGVPSIDGDSTSIDNPVKAASKGNV